MSDNHILAVEELAKSYSSDHGRAQILARVDFQVEQGQFVCVVGPSGSGKTTLLKCIAGLIKPTSGRVVFEGETVADPPAKLAVIFQDYSRSLLPWMTVEQNVELPLHKAKFPKANRARLVEEALINVGLAGKGKLYPWEMSGGMQQRAAIAAVWPISPTCS